MKAKSNWRTESGQLEREVARAPKNGRGHRRYDDDLKKRVRRYARRRNAAGTPLKSVAKELGLSTETLWGWIRRKKGSGRVRTVKVAAERRATRRRVPSAGTPTGVVVILPSGIRVEGVAADQVVSVVRGLS